MMITEKARIATISAEHREERDWFASNLRPDYQDMLLREDLYRADIRALEEAGVTDIPKGVKKILFAAAKADITYIRFEHEPS
jgi:hypothetical protein